ncbi:MAG: PRC-barrel domain containing protein [Bradyrhizobium sp.]|nr:PRC-barrel domain containing protein [Bradyrhizobium sp.]
MPQAKEHASAILREYHRAESELIGKAVVLSDGKAGTVEAVFLDEMHGLRLAVAGHPGKWPVSTIKLLQT